MARRRRSGQDRHGDERDSGGNNCAPDWQLHAFDSGAVWFHNLSCANEDGNAMEEYTVYYV